MERKSSTVDKFSHRSAAEFAAVENPQRRTVGDEDRLIVDQTLQLSQVPPLLLFRLFEDSANERVSILVPDKVPVQEFNASLIDVLNEVG